MNEKKWTQIDVVSLRMVREHSIKYCKSTVHGAEEAAAIISELIDNSDREKFVVLCLDNKNRPISSSVVSVGTLSSALVHPREVYKIAVISNASSILVGHNHPSGDPNPSKEDLEITKRLIKAGDILGISLLDHIVIGDDDYLSIRSITDFEHEDNNQ